MDIKEAKGFLLYFREFGALSSERRRSAASEVVTQLGTGSPRGARKVATLVV